MHAKHDTDPKESPAHVIGRLYDPVFFMALWRQFKFSENPEIIDRINQIGISYIISQRLDDPSGTEKHRKQLEKLGLEISRFMRLLRANKNLDLAQLMYFSALRNNQPRPETPFRDLDKHEREQTGVPYMRELRRLLNILADGIKDERELVGAKPGPRVKGGLEILALKAGLFFADLDRPFTIDAHKPFKATEAFDFVKMLIMPLDDISDANIVTAVRGAQAKMRKMRTK